MSLCCPSLPLNLKLLKISAEFFFPCGQIKIRLATYFHTTPDCSSPVLNEILIVYTLHLITMLSMKLEISMFGMHWQKVLFTAGPFNWKTVK
jgi:hypothetical protein